CSGTGFSDEVLGIIEDGKTVFDVLQIPFDEISRFFETRLHGNTEKNIKAILELVKKTGMGHLTCSRQLKTLSTGELQRLKLVSGLSARAGTNTLFFLDEPTGGLHPRDIIKLLRLFGELIEEGDTIVCVTHEQLLLNAASAIIELGPGGGTNGGRIIMRSMV
ncbi:MAG: AAA family ATPase, partial [Bacteroidales bacterium]|nr:AAA family ATPase [Bacteroidales bacterium]